MYRNKGTFQFAANFEIKAAEALDPRIVVPTVSDLTNKDTWPYDGDVLYVYNGLLVSVQEDNSIYMLVDQTKVLQQIGWKRVDSGNIIIEDTLESSDSSKALSANQGRVLLTQIQGLQNKLVNIYSYKGSKETFADLPNDAQPGDVWNVKEAYLDNPPGTNYAKVQDGSWDALGGSVDLSEFYTKTETDIQINQLIQLNNQLKIENQQLKQQLENLKPLIYAAL